MSATIPGTSDAHMAVDAAAIAVVSAAIVTMSAHVTAMTVLVVVVIAARCVAWALVSRGGPVPLGYELLFVAGCVVVGGFNDWTSVVRYGIYDYDVPSAVGWSTIPVWMLLYWGMILRAVASLCHWQRLGAPARVDDRVWLPGGVRHTPLGRLAVVLGLVLVTRQLVYRLYLNPLWSWLPFALALGVAWLVLRPRRHDLYIAGGFIVFGPLVEIAYIQLGQLHHYHLGWLAGVPLWIALWWALAVLIWKELSGRVLARLAAGFRAGGRASCRFASRDHCRDRSCPRRSPC